jgi:hypothetical protein
LHPHIEASRTKGRYLNVWAMAGLKKDEVRNAAVLAKLLDPQQLGALSRTFLANILQEIGPGYPAFSAIDTLEPYSVVTEACPLGARETRIDIVLEGCRFVLGIEVKIEALERPQQLVDYRLILQTKARLLNKSAAQRVWMQIAERMERWGRAKSG